MKILFLIHRLPCPADRGSKLRVGVQLRWLAQRHDVWCAGFLDSPNTPEAQQLTRKSLAQWRSRCRSVLAIPLRRPIATARALGHLMTGRTATEGYFESIQLRQGVKRWAEEVEFDAVMAFSSSMAPLALEVLAARRVLEIDDFDSRKWAESSRRARWPFSWVYRTEAERLACKEREWIRSFDATTVVNAREASLLSDESLRRRVHVIQAGNALDIELGSDAQGACGQDSVVLPAEPVVGFVGAMDYGPNIEAACWFAESIWPMVLQRRPEAEYWIVGRSPTRAVRKLAEGPRIRVTGTVPAVVPYLEKMRVHVAPLRMARGVQIKVLTAMAAGRPCVVTSCVAEGIGAEPGRDLLVADSPASIAEAITGLLEDDELAASIGQAGRRFISQQLRPEEGLNRLEELLFAGLPASPRDEDLCSDEAASPETVSRCELAPVV